MLLQVNTKVWHWDQKRSSLLQELYFDFEHIKVFFLAFANILLQGPN